MKLRELIQKLEEVKEFKRKIQFCKNKIEGSELGLETEKWKDRLERNQYLLDLLLSQEVGE